MDPRIIRIITPGHHNRIIDSLKIAVHMSPWGIIIINLGSPVHFIILATPEAGTGVISGERDDSETRIILTITMVVAARASNVMEAENAIGHGREHALDFGIELHMLGR